MSYGGIPYAGGPYAGAGMVAADIPVDTVTRLAVEVSFTTGALEPPAWVDIAHDVRGWDTQRGRRRELERFQPGRATVVLSNLSRQYDSVNAAGPWYGNLKPMRRMRIRETFNGVTWPIFDGYVDKWHLDYPGTGKDATATVIATDGFKIFARTDLPKSVYAKAVADSAAQTYWRLDETLAGLEEGIATNSGNGGVIKDADYTNSPRVGSQGLVVNDPGGAITVSDTAVVDGTVLQGITIPNSDLNLLTPATTRVFSVEAWVRLVEGGNKSASSVTGVLFRVSEQGTNNIHSSILYRDNGLGTERRFEFTALNSAGTNIYGVGTPLGSPVVGQVHHIVAVVETSGQMVIYLDGVRYTTAAFSGVTGTSLAGITVSTTGRITVGYDGTSSAGPVDNWGGDIDDVAVYEGIALTQADVTAHYQAGTAPWQDDLPGVRIGRILDIVGWPAALRQVDTGLTTLQSATLDMAALEHLQKVAESEFGLLFITRDGNVRFVDRTGLFARIPLGYVYGDAADGVEVGYREFTPDDGDDAIRNRALISRLNGSVRTAEDVAAIDEFGRFDYSLDGLYHRTEQYSQDYANLIVGEYADQRRRITSLVLGSPAGGAEAVAYPAMLAPELGDAIVVRSRPVGGGALFQQTCAVEGIEHAGRPGGPRTARLVLSPEFLARDWEDAVQIGYAQVTTNQGGITTEVDLTGLSVVVTVAADRRIRITGELLVESSVANDFIRMDIQEGATQLHTAQVRIGAAGTFEFLSKSVVLTPSAGSHTYKLTLQRASGTGLVQADGGASNPNFILVEDIGPA